MHGRVSPSHQKLRACHGIKGGHLPPPLAVGETAKGAPEWHVDALQAGELLGDVYSKRGGQRGVGRWVGAALGCFRWLLAAATP